MCILTSFNGKFKEPLYYLYCVDGNTTIYHSREIHHDLNGITTYQAKESNKRFNGMSLTELELYEVKAKRTESYIRIKKKAGIYKLRTNPTYVIQF